MEYAVRLRYNGIVEVVVEADSEELAKIKAEQCCELDEVDVELDYEVIGARKIEDIS